MGRGGTGLSSCASAWNGVAVISKKDRHHVTAGSFPSMALYPPVRVSIRLIETTAELGRSWGELRLLVNPAVRQKTTVFLYNRRVGLRRISPSCRSCCGKYELRFLILIKPGARAGSYYSSAQAK